MAGIYTRTSETKAKQSAAMTGRFKGVNSPLYGVPKSKEHRRKISKAKKGKPSTFKGKKHTEQSKQNISFSRVGIVLTREQRAERKKLKTKNWMKNNPEKIAVYDRRSLQPRAKANSERRRKLRLAAIAKLGGRCVSSKCGWFNEDNTRGCTDYRALQFDHIKGGGTSERKKQHFEGLCKEILADVTGKFQLLCANCNWIKAFEKREFRFKYEIEEAIR